MRLQNSIIWNYSVHQPSLNLRVAHQKVSSIRRKGDAPEEKISIMTGDEEDTSKTSSLQTAVGESVTSNKPVDWSAAAALPSFRSLMSTRLRFTVPALVLSLGFYLAVTLFVGFAPEAASHRVFGSINVGYLLVFAVYVVTLVSAVLYVRFCSTVLDPKAENCIAQIRELEQSCKH